MLKSFIKFGKQKEKLPEDLILWFSGKYIKLRGARIFKILKNNIGQASRISEQEIFTSDYSSMI